MSLRVSRFLRAGLLQSAKTPAGITNRLLLTMGSPRENIFYLKPIDSVTVPGTEGTFTITNNHSLVISQLSPGVITVRDGTEHKDFFISDGFIFFNQPSDGSGCCRAEISGVELVPKEALDKDRATQLLSEVQSAAKETEWDKVKAQLGRGSNLATRNIRELACPGCAQQNLLWDLATYFSQLQSTVMHSSSSPPLAILVTLALCHAGSSPVGVPPTFGSLFTMDELHCKDNPHNYPCLEEMKVYRETQGAKGEDAVVRCASKAVADANDFHTLRNLSHVLLDMDTIIKVFDNSSSIVRVGIEAARKLTNHPDCLREFGTKDSLDCRCFPLYSKVAMLKYKNYGWWAEARQYFRQIQGFTYKGVPNPVGWEDIYRTPQIYIPNLRAHEIWPRGEWEEALPIGVALEQNYKAILAETKEAMRKDELWEDTYRFLYKNGTWKHLPIYHAREIIEPQCTAMPTLCGLVKKYLPTKPGLPWVVNQNEQVMVIRMDPGTTVETHNGPSNNVLNMHFGIVVPEGAVLTVNYTQYTWENGKTLVWDGSTDHGVDTTKSKEERIILLVRLMHPDMTPQHYRGHKRTMFEEIPAEYRDGTVAGKEAGLEKQANGAEKEEEL